MRRAAIYTRKSKFTTSGESIETQINLCRDYARERLGIDEFEVYEDEGFSGGDTKRPNLQRMLRDAEKKFFDVIICYRLDRISRNVADFSKLINELELLNIKFVSIKEQFDTSTPMGRAMMSIAAVFAQLERETIAERVKDNMLELAKGGRWLGGIPPTGFESMEEIVVDSSGVKRKTYKLNPIPGELEKIRLIYNKFLEVKNLRDLKDSLSSLDIKSKNNKPFDRSSLKVILTNPVYAVGDNSLYKYFMKNNIVLTDDSSKYTGERGVLTYNKYREKKGGKRILRDASKWIVALGSHEGIIPSKDWIKVQSILSEYKRNPPRLGTSIHALLTSLLYCHKCGSHMRVISKYREGQLTSYYYKCTKKEKTLGKECSCPNLNGKEADDIIINFIKSIEIDETRVISLLGETQPTWAPEKSVYGNITIYKKQINKYQKSIDNLMLLLSENEDSNASRYMIKEIEELHIKIRNLEEKTKKASEAKDICHNSKDLIRQLEYVNSNIDLLGIEFRKSLIRELISKISWDGEILEIKLLDNKN